MTERGPRRPAPGDRYVAMGSSFAAGPGTGPRSPGSPRSAGRCDANYAHLLTGRAGLELTDASWSGETAAQMLAGGHGRPPQVEALTRDTRLVTVTCGGNDVGYMPLLMLGSVPATLRSLPAVRRRTDALLAATDGRFDRLPGTFDRLLAEVRRRAPEATVVLVDYLTILPPEDGASAWPLSPEIADWARRTAQRLATETAAAASRAGCLLVNASAASRDHHAWSDDPWSHRLRLGRRAVPYHPNAEGMRAVADLVEQALTPEPG
jgi:lysophospholipase L1-like esterase